MHITHLANWRQGSRCRLGSEIKLKLALAGQRARGVGGAIRIPAACGAIAACGQPQQLVARLRHYRATAGLTRYSAGARNAARRCHVGHAHHTMAAIANNQRYRLAQDHVAVVGIHLVSVAWHDDGRASRAEAQRAAVALCHSCSASQVHQLVGHCSLFVL
ncbi:hypothetical protein D3C71_1595250 [compost metagenome]